MSIAMRLTSQEREFVLIHNCNRTKHPRYVDCFMRGRPPMKESTLHSDHNDQCQLCCIIPTINNIIQGRGSAPLAPPPQLPLQPYFVVVKNVLASLLLLHTVQVLRLPLIIDLLLLQKELRDEHERRTEDELSKQREYFYI